MNDNVEQERLKAKRAAAIPPVLRDCLRATVPASGEAYLFGSRARGDARPDSDWDILVLLDKERITPEDRDKISYPIYETSWELDVDVNPVMYTKADWAARSFTPFYKNVMADRIRL